MNIKLIGLNDNYHVLVTGGGGFIGSNLCLDPLTTLLQVTM